MPERGKTAVVCVCVANHTSPQHAFLVQIPVCSTRIRPVVTTTRLVPRFSYLAPLVQIPVYVSAPSLNTPLSSDSRVCAGKHMGEYRNDLPPSGLPLFP